MIRGAFLGLQTDYYPGKMSHIKGYTPGTEGEGGRRAPGLFLVPQPALVRVSRPFQALQGGRRAWITESQPWTSHGPAVTDRKGVVRPLPSCLHPGPDQGCTQVF